MPDREWGKTVNYDFAALRFVGDANISDRVYWYLCDFPVKAGDAVIAPVGIHDRLQYACVERVLSAPASEAPYDIRLCKRITAKYGARKLVLEGTKYCRELGGLRCDGKHFTRYGAFLCAEFGGPIGSADALVLGRYGVTDVIGHTVSEENSRFRCYVPHMSEFYGEDMADAFRICAEALGCVLIERDNGMGSALPAVLLSLAGVAEQEIIADFRLVTSGLTEAGEVAHCLEKIRTCGGAEAFLSDIGLTRGEILHVKEKLT